MGHFHLPAAPGSTRCLEMGFLWQAPYYSLLLPPLPPTCCGPESLEVDLKRHHQAPTKRSPSGNETLQLMFRKVGQWRSALIPAMEGESSCRWTQPRPPTYWCFPQTEGSSAMSLHPSTSANGWLECGWEMVEPSKGFQFPAASPRSDISWTARSPQYWSIMYLRYIVTCVGCK